MMGALLHRAQLFFISHLDMLHVTDDQPCAQRLTSASCQMAGKQQHESNLDG